MEPRTLQFIAQACAGELRCGSPTALARRVCTDSRAVRPGDAFFALSGEKFDGHDFVAEVSAREAAVVVVNRQRLPLPDVSGPLIAVEDSRRALACLASAHRREFSLPVVAVGGSNGKTTTKELTASVLRQKYSTLWSEASFNNDIGVPLTLLRLESHHEAAVLEVGTNHPGELAPLARWIEPRFGIITSIGREHLEFFGDLAGVAAEEGALAEALPATGRLFLNGDAPFAAEISARCRGTVVRVGFGEANDWRLSDPRSDESGLTFRTMAPLPAWSGDWRVNLLGRHQAVNAALALAVGAELGLTPEEARRGLVACPPPKMRLQASERNGVRILNDAYNANADSMLAALETLREFPCAGRRIAVLGEMAELGGQTAEAHAEVGRRAAELGLNLLVTVGRLAALTAQAAREAGLREIKECRDVSEATVLVKESVRAGDVVLLKASRISGLERVCEGLG